MTRIMVDIITITIIIVIVIHVVIVDVVGVDGDGHWKQGDWVDGCQRWAPFFTGFSLACIVCLILNGIWISHGNFDDYWRERLAVVIIVVVIVVIVV